MKTIILLDFEKLNVALTELDIELNQKEFLDFLKSIYEESEVQTAYAYVGINDKLPHTKDKIVDDLLRTGYIVREIKGENYGLNFISDCSQAITLDAMRSVYENKATNVIIVSNSNRLENLVTVLREKDIVVENVFYGVKADYDLAIKSTGFIDLDNFISDDEDKSEDITDNNSDTEELVKQYYDEPSDMEFNIEFNDVTKERGKSENESDSKIILEEDLSANNSKLVIDEIFDEEVNNLTNKEEILNANSEVISINRDETKLDSKNNKKGEEE